jgi:DNA-binding winged helix-turn-helix (wHTH) protein
MATKGNDGFAVLSPVIRFDRFELEIKSGQLCRNGAQVNLPPQALKVLAMLVERPGDLVPRKEIKEALWPGQCYGDFDSRLNFTIRKLREALGDDAEQARYVQTVRNAGYRFIAPVRERAAVSFVLPDSTDRAGSDGNGSQPGAKLGVLASANKVQLGSNGFFLALITIAVVALATAVLFQLRTHEAGLTPDSSPEIASVTPIVPEARQRIVIKGRGFGLHVPYVHTDSPYLAIRNETAHWAAGRIIPWNSDEVMVDVESWTDTEIVVSGFSGDYGVKGWKLAPGDNLEIAVWNPESGVGPALYHLTVSVGNSPR